MNLNNVLKDQSYLLPKIIEGIVQQCYPPEASKLLNTLPLSFFFYNKTQIISGHFKKVNNYEYCDAHYLGIISFEIKNMNIDIEDPFVLSFLISKKEFDRIFNINSEEEFTFSFSVTDRTYCVN